MALSSTEIEAIRAAWDAGLISPVGAEGGWDGCGESLDKG